MYFSTALFAPISHRQFIRRFGTTDYSKFADNHGDFRHSHFPRFPLFSPVVPPVAVFSCQPRDFPDFTRDLPANFPRRLSRDFPATTAFRRSH